MEVWNERVRRSFILEYTSESSYDRVNLLEILLIFPCPSFGRMTALIILIGWLEATFHLKQWVTSFWFKTSEDPFRPHLM